MYNLEVKEIEFEDFEKVLTSNVVLPSMGMASETFVLEFAKVLLKK